MRDQFQYKIFIVLERCFKQQDWQDKSLKAILTLKRLQKDLEQQILLQPFLSESVDFLESTSSQV